MSIKETQDASAESSKEPIKLSDKTREQINQLFDRLIETEVLAEQNKILDNIALILKENPKISINEIVNSSNLLEKSKEQQDLIISKIQQRFLGSQQMLDQRKEVLDHLSNKERKKSRLHM